MGKKIIGLSFVSVGADCHDDVGDFSVLIAIVEFADAHITRGMTFRVVSRTIVYAHHRRFHRRELQLARAPGILETATGAAVIEAIEREFAWAIVVENFLRQPSVKGNASSQVVSSH